MMPQATRMRVSRTAKVAFSEELRCFIASTSITKATIVLQTMRYRSHWN